MKYDNMSRGQLIREIVACRKQLEETSSSLQQKEDYQQKYVELIQGSLDGFAMLDEKGRFTFCNDVYCSITGYGIDALNSLTYQDLTPEEYHKLDKKNLDLMYARGHSDLYEKEYIKSNGERVPIEIQSYLIKDKAGNFSGTWSYVRDISDRIQAENDLHKQKQLLQKAQEIGKIGTWELDILKDELFWTDENHKIFGIPIGTKLTYEIFLDCVHPDDREYVDTEWKAAFTGKPYDIEHRLIVNGKTKWVREKATLEFDESDNCIKGTGFTQDITDKKQSEIEKLEEKQKAERYLDLAGVMFIGLDAEGNVNLANKKACSVLECTEKEIVGKNWFDNFIPQENRNAVSSVYKQLINGATESVEYYENSIISKTGKEKKIAWNNTSISNELGEITGCIGSGEDITEKRRLEAQLLQSQKMEAIGNLAGGIAHDFNNILSSIIGFTELVLDDVEKGTNTEDSLQEVYAAGKRAKDLVKQILAFARQSDEKLKPVEVGSIAREVLKFIRSSIPVTIEIKQNIKSASLILGNPTQVHQVLMNLCTNAAHAMESNGGTLQLHMVDTVIDSPSMANKIGVKPGDYIKIELSDTGVGIKPDILGSIFEPYFTTKATGEGTGMGLAMTHGIVESYGGKITVDSTLGKGTVFTIYLPITKKQKAARPYKPESLPSGTEKILFVDDEVPLSKMGEQTLARLGYAVTTRTNSVEALELFRSRPGDFDLVITDMTMPNLTGDKLAFELMKIRPDIPVIIYTGYSKKMTKDNADKIGIKAFAYKPIVKADLAKTVRKVLDEANG